LIFGVGHRDFGFKIFRIGFCLGFHFRFEWAFSIFPLLSTGAGVHSQAPLGKNFPQGGGVVNFSAHRTTKLETPNRLLWDFLGAVEGWGLICGQEVSKWRVTVRVGKVCD
jgi:hypothetical protein